MKREALLRELRALAKERNVTFAINAVQGKGSHYRVSFGNKKSTIQSGELDPLKVRRIKKQLGV